MMVETGGVMVSRVRFCDESLNNVVVYELDPVEVEMKRMKEELNSEYRREMTLYSFLVKWKRYNEQESKVEIGSTTPLENLFGKDRAQVLLQHGCMTFGDLLGRVSESVSQAWPIMGKMDEKEYNLSCVIVLNLVADFLVKFMPFNLADPSEQNVLYASIFHVTQQILKPYKDAVLL